MRKARRTLTTSDGQPGPNSISLGCILNRYDSWHREWSSESTEGHGEREKSDESAFEHFEKIIERLVYCTGFEVVWIGFVDVARSVCRTAMDGWTLERVGREER